MALNYDPRMYTQGGVEFDSRPHIQLYGQLLAKKQAQKEAFDEYIRNLNKSVNSAGLRNADRQVFDKKLSDWQNYTMQNRDAIRNRKGGADIEFQKQYQDILNLTARSKGLEESKKPAIELLLKPEVRDRLGDDFINEIAAHDEPIYRIGANGQIEENPDFKPLDYTKISFNPKPFEQDKYFKQFEDIKRMELPPVADPKTMTMTTTSVFDDQAKDAIATRAVADYMNNSSFKSVVDKLDPKEYDAVFQANYGRPIQSPADLAAAYTLKGLQQTTTKVDPDVFARQKEMARINDANARGRLGLAHFYRKAFDDYKKAGSKQNQDQVLEAWIQRTFNEGKRTNNPIMFRGKFVPGRQIAVPVDIKKKYTLTSGTGDDKVTEVPRFVMTADKKYVIPLYPNRKSDYQEPIPIETFRNEIGKIWLSAKDRVGEMDEVSFDNEGDVKDITTKIISKPQDNIPEKSQSKPLPKGKPRTIQQNGYTYEWDEKTGTYK